MTLLQKILPREIRNRVASLASLSRTLLSALKVPYPRKRTVLGQPCWLITLKWAFSFSYCLQQTRAHSSRPGATGASSALLESGVQPPGVMMNFCITRKRTGSTFSPYHTPTTQAQWEEGGVAPTSQEIAAMLLHMWRRASAQFPPPPHPPHTGSCPEGAGESSFPELLAAPATLCSCPLSASYAWLTCVLSLAQAAWITAVGLQSQPKGGPTHPVSVDALCPTASFPLLGFPRPWSPHAANQTEPVGGGQATRQEWASRRSRCVRQLAHHSPLPGRTLFNSNPHHYLRINQISLKKKKKCLAGQAGLKLVGTVGNESLGSCCRSPRGAEDAKPVWYKATSFSSEGSWSFFPWQERAHVHPAPKYTHTLSLTHVVWGLERGVGSPGSCWGQATRSVFTPHPQCPPHRVSHPPHQISACFSHFCSSWPLTWFSSTQHAASTVWCPSYYIQKDPVNLLFILILSWCPSKAWLQWAAKVRNRKGPRGCLILWSYHCCVPDSPEMMEVYGCQAPLLGFWTDLVQPPILQKRKVGPREREPFVLYRTAEL